MRVHNRKRVPRVKEAVDLFGAFRNTVRAWDAAGKIPEYRHPANACRLHGRKEFLRQIKAPRDEPEA